MVFIIKLVNGPDDGGGEIHCHGEQSVGRQEAWEGNRKQSSPLSNAHEDDGCRQDKADAVDRETPFCCCILVIRHRITDENEDDAGDKGLADFQNAWRCSHVAGHLAWTCLTQADLAEVSERSEAGEDSGDNATIDIFLTSLVAF